MGQRFLIVTEGGEVAGYGHLVRCAQIAAQMAAKGWEITVATGPDLDRPVELFPAGAAIIPHDARSPTVHNLPDAELALVDSFKLDRSFERDLRGKARMIAAIDGMLRPHHVDVLIDPFEHSQEQRSGCHQTARHILAGPSFIPISPEFCDPELTLSRRPDRLGISLGGSPEPEDIEALVRALQVIGFSGEAALISPRAMPAAKDLAMKHHSWCSDMPRFYASCGVVIGNCGMSAWERCAGGMPSMAFVMADNQRYIAEVLEKAGAALVVHHRPAALSDSELARVVGGFLSDRVALAHYGERARELCDGQGAARIADTLCRLQ